MNERSVGKIIEDKRKELGLTIEECSKKTRISRKFLEAIESDNYDAFPGEVYYIGFLRTYAQLLSLDANKLIHSYNKQKRIEEPAPLEELTKPLKREFKIPTLNKNSLPIILGILVIIIVFVGVFLIFNMPKQEKQEIAIKENKVRQIKNENEFILNQRKIVKSFMPGSIIVIPDQDNYYKINILELDKNNNQVKISFSNLADTFIIKEKDIIQIDFNENNNPDLQLILNQISSNGIIFSIERLTSDRGDGILTTQKITIKSSDIDKTSAIKPESNLFPENISIIISATKTGYVRIESDTEGMIEKILNPGDSIKISGKNEIIVQLSNANYMSVNINNQQIQLPKEFLVYCIVKLVYDQQTEKYNIVTEFKK